MKTLYFNYNYLREKTVLERKKIFYHELLYFCNDIEEMKKVENKTIFNGLEDKKNIMELISKILEILFQIIKDDNNIQRIIILDNIYDNDIDTIKNLNNIINIINKKSSNIKLILSGNGPYFNEKFIEFYEEFHALTNEENYFIYITPI